MQLTSSVLVAVTADATTSGEHCAALLLLTVADSHKPMLQVPIYQLDRAPRYLAPHSKGSCCYKDAMTVQLYCPTWLALMLLFVNTGRAAQQLLEAIAAER